MRLARKIPPAIQTSTAAEVEIVRKVWSGPLHEEATTLRELSFVIETFGDSG